MSTPAPSAIAAFAPAQASIRLVLAGTVAEVAHDLLMRMKNAPTYYVRGELAVAQRHLLEQHDRFLAAFAQSLSQSIADDIASSDAERAPADETDWQSISLVDDDKIESAIAFKRIGQLIGHASEAELSELDGYASAVLGHASADPHRNPLRGDVLGNAIHAAIGKVTDGAETQKILAHEFGLSMARAMPGCYREIIDAFKGRGVRALVLELKPVDDPGRAPSGSHPAFDEAREHWEKSWAGRMSTLPPDTLRSWESSLAGRFGNIDPVPTGFDPISAWSLLDRLMRGAVPAPLAASADAGSGSASREMFDLLRRLNVAAHERGSFVRTQPDSGPGPYAHERFGPLSQRGTPASLLGDLDALARGEQPPAERLSELMAVNLIRAHREEIERTAKSRLDHLVIEVVSSLFDQILSDARVTPQMARQIARLQLPVLRVSLADPGLFSSRRHPVRRFVNRIASLASAFDDVETESFKELLARVDALVTDIVEGEFDQLDIYDAKLGELERFVADTTHAQTRISGAAPTLRAKEIEWRVEVLFGQRLRAALEPLSLPSLLLDFLSGPWAQAIVAASREGRSTGPAALERRRAGVDLIVSLLPKPTLAERERFVRTLPQLMAALRTGVDAIGWLQPARDAFFGELVALHMASLKAQPNSALDHNLTLLQIEAAFKTPLPREGDEDDPAAVPVPQELFAEQRFSPDEQRAIGLVAEESIDWQVPVIEPGAAEPAISPASAPESTPDSPRAPGTGTAKAVVDADALPIIDAGLGTSPDPAARFSLRDAPSTASANAPLFTTGSELRERLELGMACLLNLSGSWHKVRLTYMNPARNLFLFSHGDKERETVSMTTRTLDRLCAGGRMHAFEGAALLERSVERARKQLAALGSERRPAAA